MKLTSLKDTPHHNQDREHFHHPKRLPGGPVKLREEWPHTSGRGRKKVTNFEVHQNILFLIRPALKRNFY